MSSYEPHMVYTHKDNDDVITVHVVWRESSGAICYVMEIDPLDECCMYALITPAGVTLYKAINRIPAGSGDFLVGTSLTSQGPHHGDSIRFVPNDTTGIGFNTLTISSTWHVRTMDPSSCEGNQPFTGTSGPAQARYSQSWTIGRRRGHRKQSTLDTSREAPQDTDATQKTSGSFRLHL